MNTVRGKPAGKRGKTRWRGKTKKNTRYVEKKMMEQISKDGHSRREGGGNYLLKPSFWNGPQQGLVKGHRGECGKGGRSKSLSRNVFERTLVRVKKRRELHKEVGKSDRRDPGNQDVGEDEAGDGTLRGYWGQLRKHRRKNDVSVE